MIRSLSLIIFIFTAQLVVSFPDPGKGSGCRAFKTGKYKLVEKNRAYRIERDKNFQIETDLNTNEQARFKIHWVSACQYELTLVQGRADLMTFYKDKTLVIRILETYDNGYKFEAKLKDIASPAVVHTIERLN